MTGQIKPGAPVRLRASGLSGIVREVVKGGYRVEIPSAAPLPGGLPHTAIVAADELEVQATASEAHRIASARLGPALHNVTRGGPNGDEWLVQAVPPSGPLLSARAASLEEAIGAAEAQLRAAGWVPTHPRLEWKWYPADEEFDLPEYADLGLLIGNLTDPLWILSIQPEPDPICPGMWQSYGRLVTHGALPEILAAVAEWCATNLPSLHLPPFPETPE